MNNTSVGTRWYKCDLHLHTPASLCFKDRNNITPEQWVQEAIDKGLHCVAVTDHNTAEWVDKIKIATQDTLLTVFPGIEITCSDAKIHLLILFDVECTKQNVEDFLIKAKIERKDFGIQTAHTNLNLEDIANLANNERALIIPAHIDEFAGLCNVAPKIAKDFYALSIINSVQVVHEGFTLPDGKIYNNQRDEFLIHLNRYYGLKETDIENKKWEFSDERMKNARRVVLDAINTKKAILTFSDNPHEQGDSSHGLWGIGTRHTWIKMEVKPSLESLRQALLLPKLRVRNDFDNCPNQCPELWIQKIIIKNTEISDPKNTELCIEFSPQMNTIIGGRGSGKSSILQFIRGAFGRGDELKPIENIHVDFLKFFQKKQKGKNKSGVLREDSCIEVHITRKEIEYLISYENQQTTVSQFNTSTNTFEIKNNTEILNRLEFDIFSQKQIYEIATSPNSLRTRIDKSDPIISQIENELKLKSDSYVEQSKKVKELNSAIAGKDKILLDIEELEVKINQFKTSNAGELLEKLQNFEEEGRLINYYISQIEIIDFDELIEELNGIDYFDTNPLRDEYQVELNSVFSDNLVKIKLIKTELEGLKVKYNDLATDLNTKIEVSNWQKIFNEIQISLNKTKTELLEQGVDLTSIQNDITSLSNKKQELEIIAKKENELLIAFSKKEEIKKEYFGLRQKLQQQRQSFLDSILKDRNVRAKVKFCRDLDDYEEALRRIFSLDETNYSNDLKIIMEKWSKPGNEKFLDQNQEIFNLLSEHNQNKTIDNQFGKLFFTNKVHNLNDKSLIDLDLLFPEDEIQIDYKVGNTYKSILNASAGQKTAAILTLLLSHGTTPLILDQPEDDLDNRLIYDLVVDQMKTSKEVRQIIVVTHNANIPVNGDSEHIIVMDSETKHIQVKFTGSVETKEIKQEICNIMEGGIDAFDMRSKRYGELFTA